MSCHVFSQHLWIINPWSSQQQCHLAFISEFTMDIKHIDGKSNIMADCLSRANVQAVHLGIQFVQLAANQQSDPDVQAYRTAISSLKIADVRFTKAGVMLMCDVSRGHPRPVVQFVTPWAESFTKTGLIKVCVAWTENRCSDLGFNICGMSAG